MHIFRFLTITAIAVAMTGCCCLQEVERSPSTHEVEIRLATGTALEQKGREQLERILSRYDFSRWLFTRTVQIQSRAIPHSHPVLTLNTQYLGDDTVQAANFLHEQLHWFLDRHEAATDSAIADLQRAYPEAPDGPPRGAQNRESTYLHLLIGVLEFDAMRKLFGEATAHQMLDASQFYTWIYREVLERPKPIQEILRKHGLDSPDARM